RVGRKGDREEQAEVFSPDGKVRPLAATATKANGAVSVGVGAAQVSVRPNQAPPQNNLPQFRQFYLNQFRAADKDKKGYIERKELQANRQLQFIYNAFPLADRDEDGKLTEKEFLDFIDIQNRVASSYTVLTVTDQGRGLFEALDANRDGRLSIRELR